MKARLTLMLLGCSLASAGCSSDSDTARPEPSHSIPTTLTVTSSAFADGEAIPDQFTCRGLGEIPPLAWSGDVTQAAAIAVVVDDPDAPGGTYTHWIVLDLPAGATTLDGELPPGAVEARNSDGGTGWTAPCPPSDTHHYRFTVYALHEPTGLAAGASTEDALAAIEANAVASGRLTGLVDG